MTTRYSSQVTFATRFRVVHLVYQTGNKNIYRFPVKTTHTAPESKCSDKPGPICRAFRATVGFRVEVSSVMGSLGYSPSEASAPTFGWRSIVGAPGSVRAREFPRSFNAVWNPIVYPVLATAIDGAVPIWEKLAWRGHSRGFRESPHERHAIVCRSIQERAMTVSLVNVLLSQLIWWGAGVTGPGP